MSHWTRIDNEVIDRAATIGATAVMVYLAIARHADTAGVSFPSVARIGKIAGVQPRAVRRAISRLAGMGLIEVSPRSNPRGTCTTNQYRLLPPDGEGVSGDKVVSGDRGRVSLGTGGGCFLGQGEGVPRDRDEAVSRNTPVNKKPPEQEPGEQKPPKSPKGDIEVELPAILDTAGFREAWGDWQAHRREIRKPLKPTQIKKQLAQFEKWGEDRSIAAINHTITNGWTGIREPERPGPFRPRSGDPRGNQEVMRQFCEEANA